MYLHSEFRICSLKDMICTLVYFWLMKQVWWKKYAARPGLEPEIFRLRLCHTLPDSTTGRETETKLRKSISGGVRWWLLSYVTVKRMKNGHGPDKPDENRMSAGHVPDKERTRNGWVPDKTDDNHMISGTLPVHFRFVRSISVQRRVCIRYTSGLSGPQLGICKRKKTGWVPDEYRTSSGRLPDSYRTSNGNVFPFRPVMNFEHVEKPPRGKTDSIGYQRTSTG